MGGNLVLYHGLTQDSTVKGVIATSPGLEVAKVPPVTQFLGKLMYSVFPRFSVNNSLDVTGLSPDPNVVTAYQNDPLVHPKVSARLGLDIMKNGLWIRENAAKITKPLFIAHGDNDRLASITGTRDFVQRTKGDITYMEFPGGYHELHNSPEQTILFAEILKWIDAKILAGAESPS
jgi:alpha-beta hydrolase superfamily lysophospholipase